MDLYRLLKADHRRANDLFKQIAQTSDRAARTRQRLFDQLRGALDAHGEAEEKHFYKALARHADLKDMVSVARKDHREMRKRLAQIAALAPGTRDFLQEVKALQKQVRLHVREEEQGIFPVARQVLDKEQAQRIADRIEAFEAERLPKEAQRPTARKRPAAAKAPGKRAAPKRTASRQTPARAAAQAARSPRRRG